MVYKTYKEGTGVRARSDLSANAKPVADDAPLTREQMVMAADHLLRLVKESTGEKKVSITLSNRAAQRIADALLQAEHQQASQ